MKQNLEKTFQRETIERKARNAEGKWTSGKVVRNDGKAGRCSGKE